MRRYLLVMTLAAASLTGCCPRSVIVPVTLRAQETANWCWAASTHMVIDSLGGDVPQCEMANRRFGRTDCCAGTCPQPAACNQPGWPMLTEYGYAHLETATPLTFAAIKEQIRDRKRALVHVYGPKSGGVGHVVVIYGFIDAAGIQSVLIRDPWAPCAGNTRSQVYEEYSGSLSSDHWMTAHDIQGPGGAP